MTDRIVSHNEDYDISVFSWLAANRDVDTICLYPPVFSHVDSHTIRI